MASGSITNEQVDFVETWENVSPMTNFVIKLDMRGDEKHEQISERRNFRLTTQERMLTQEKILDPRHDPFRNGCFRPVITPEDITIETNPNSLSDDDIIRIFGASQVAWEEWLANVDSDATLRRMVELADNDENIAHKRVMQLNARLREVTGGPKHATQKDEETYKSLGGQSADKSARKGAAKRAMTSSTSSNG